MADLRTGDEWVVKEKEQNAIATSDRQDEYSNGVRSDRKWWREHGFATPEARLSISLREVNEALEKCGPKT